MSHYLSHLRHWRIWVALLAGVWAAIPSSAAASNSDPQVFKPGHYRLADGLLRTGSLFLVSDNELLVKNESAAEPQRFAAVQVRNFVIGTDSFAVLRKFDVVVNGVVDHYSCAIVRVYQATGGLELYGLQGPIEVYNSPSTQTVLQSLSMGLKYGLVGSAVGAAAGALRDKSNARYEERMMTLLLFRPPGASELQTIIPQTKSTRSLLEKTLVGPPELKSKMQSLQTADYTNENIVRLIAYYVKHNKQ